MNKPTTRYELMLLNLLGLTNPIILAPMSGGVGTSELCAAVSNEGGLGSLPTGYLTPAELEINIAQVKKLSTKPFVVNLFINEKVVESNLGSEHKKLETYLNQNRSRLGLKPVKIADVHWHETAINKWVNMIIREQVPVVSVTFGCLPIEEIQRLHQHNILVFGTATSCDEALYLKKMGCNAIIAQGYEAGGHQGTFLNKRTNPLSTFALVPQLVDILGDTPVIAAGGIADGRGVHAALALGAEAVQIGTAFIPAEESGAHNLYKSAILNSQTKGTRLTDRITGKPARALDNNWIDALEQFTPLPYPLQHYCTVDIRNAALGKNNEMMSTFWAGQSAPLCKGGSVKTIMESMLKEYEKSLVEISANIFR
jgi:nitronate monooxygenase